MPSGNDGRHRFLSGGHPDMPESWDGGSRLTRRGGAAAPRRGSDGTGGQQQDRGHGERHRRGTRLAQAARLGGIHLAVRARLDRRLLRSGLLAINLHQSLPGAARGKRVSHLGGSRVLVGGDLLRSVEGGLELVRAGLVLVLGQLFGGGKLDREIASIGKARLLIIDELGYVPIDEEGSRLLFQVITNAYEMQSIVYTTNIEFSGWGRVFGDPNMAAAIIDRTVHHGRMLRFEGESYRRTHALMQ